MSESQNIPPKTEKRKNEWLYLILILLLLGSNGTMGWFWYKDRGRLQVVTVEKEDITAKAELVKEELSALQIQYSNLKGTNAAMQADIDAKKEEIEKLQKIADKHKEDAWIISKLKKETETLRRIMQHFVVEIDSLHTLNNTVIAERENVKKELKAEKEVTAQLTKEKEGLQETVNIASMLKAVGVKATGISEKKGGKKESETSKAKRADKIKISFTLAENIVAKNGERIIYARIVTPDGKELTPTEDESH